MLLSGGFATIACLQLLIFTAGFYHAEGKKGFGDTEQEWGYVNVRPNAHMFWWLYYTTSKDVTNVHEKPLVIWLQGGPGASSTGYGNFQELGPLDLNLKPRNYTWVKDYNVLFIDNPVGAGYSYSETYSGFAKNNAQIASDLLECMRGFYKEFPEWLNASTYITSESYGGKMAVEFALVWDKAQKDGSLESNFKGVLLIDSWISPIDSVLSWGRYLLETGMVDTEGFNKIEGAAETVKIAVDEKRWSSATQLWANAENVILQMTGNIDFYNILYNVASTTRSKLPLHEPILSMKKKARDASDALLSSLMNNEVKRALGAPYINVTWGSQSSSVFSILAGDFMQPATDQVARLLNDTEIDVWVLTGQLDLIVATPGTVHWVENLEWSESNEWHKAPRQELVVDNVIEGYVKQYKHFKMCWINRSGHMVPRDNPRAMAAILQKLTAH